MLVSSCKGCHNWNVNIILLFIYHNSMQNSCKYSTHLKKRETPVCYRDGNTRQRVWIWITMKHCKLRNITCHPIMWILVSAEFMTSIMSHICLIVHYNAWTLWAWAAIISSDIEERSRECQLKQYCLKTVTWHKQLTIFVLGSLQPYCFSLQSLFNTYIYIYICSYEDCWNGKWKLSDSISANNISCSFLMISQSNWLRQPPASLKVYSKGLNVDYFELL